MSVLATGAFWVAALERAVKTFAQSILAVLAVAGVTPADIDWKEALAVGGIGALASLLTSVASAPIGNAGPSAATEVLTPPAAAVPADAPQV
jgi:hypothetical protein